MAVNYRGVACGFRIFGLASSPQNLVNIENDTGSGVFIAVFEFKLFKDMLTLQNALTPVTRLTTPTGTRTGGADMQVSKVAVVGTDTFPSSVRFRHASSADGTVSTIAGVTAGTTLIWETQPLKMVTLAGLVANATPDVIPETCRTKPIVIPAGESRLLQLVNAGIAGTASAGDQYYPEIFFEIGTSASDWG